MAETRVYKVKAPDGTIVRVQGPSGATEDEVLSQAKALYKGPSAAQQQSRAVFDTVEGAMKLAAKAPQSPARLIFGALGTNDKGHVLNKGFSFGYGDEILGGLAGAVNNASNFVTRFTGGRKLPTGDQMYQASVDEQRRRVDDYTEANPGKSAALQLSGTLANPLSWRGGKWVSNAPSLLGTMGRSALLGAGFGGVAGFGGAEGNAVERLPETAQGSALGGMFGAAIPGGVHMARQVPRLLMGARGGLEEAGARIAQMAGRAAPEAVVTPRATELAEEAVARLASRITPSQLAANELQAAGKPVTAAEAIGRPAMSTLTALGRRSGTTADELEGLITARMEAMPQRVVDDIQGTTGVDPMWVEGDVQGAADKLRELARPLYEEAYERTAQSPVLERLLARPSMKDAMRRGARIAREEDFDPNTLGLFDMEAPLPSSQGASPRPNVDDVQAVRGMGIPDAARDLRRAQGPELMEYIARNGGINEGGELAAMDAQAFHQARPFMNRLFNAEGDTADGWALRAWENGYFPKHTERPNPEELLDALRESLAGKGRYARDATQAAEKLDGLRALEEEFNRSGIAVTGKADDLADELGNYRGEQEGLEYLAAGGGSPRPQYEPVYGEIPSMRGLDYAKRGLDDIVEGYREPLTGKLNLDTEGRAVVSTVKELRDELVRLNGVYGKALKAGGEPIRLEQAYKDGPKLFNASTPESVFMARIGKMSKVERDAMLGGWVADAYNSARAGRLKPKVFRSPAFRAKLEALAGKQKADELNKLLSHEVLLARGNRMAPGTNSVTAEVLEASRELDGGRGFLSDMATRLDSGSNPLAAATASAVRTLASPAVGFVRGMQVPQTQAVRNEMGRLLMTSPDELAKILEARGIIRPMSRPNLAPVTNAGAGFLGALPAQ